MKKTFSTNWKASKQVRKQRKYRSNAPLHIKAKMLGSNLSKPLREKHKRRTISVRKGDEVRILSGQFKGKTGKINSVNVKRLRVSIEGIQRAKKDGTKIAVWFAPSNLQIQELNLEDKRRIKERKIVAKEEKSTKKIKETK